MKRILEIGPKNVPLHDRKNGFELKNNESYVGLDIDRDKFDKEFWDGLKAKYGDRVALIQGDMKKLPFADKSQDQVVLLGSCINRSNFSEVDRVLKNGGEIVFGMRKEYSEIFFSEMGDVLRNSGYEFKNSEVEEYDYREVYEKELKKKLHNEEIDEFEYDNLMSSYGITPYVVLKFEKF